jgi:hypothetical protein
MPPATIPRIPECATVLIGRPLEEIAGVMDLGLFFRGRRQLPNAVSATDSPHRCRVIGVGRDDDPGSAGLRRQRQHSAGILPRHCLRSSLQQVSITRAGEYAAQSSCGTVTPMLKQVTV